MANAVRMKFLTCAQNEELANKLKRLSSGAVWPVCRLSNVPTLSDDRHLDQEKEMAKHKQKRKLCSDVPRLKSTESKRWIQNKRQQMAGADRMPDAELKNAQQQAESQPFRDKPLEEDYDPGRIRVRLTVWHGTHENCP